MPPAPTAPSASAEVGAAVESMSMWSEWSWVGMVSMLVIDIMVGDGVSTCKPLAAKMRVKTVREREWGFISGCPRACMSVDARFTVLQ